MCWYCATIRLVGTIYTFPSSVDRNKKKTIVNDEMFRRAHSIVGTTASVCTIYYGKWNSLCNAPLNPLQLKRRKKTHHMIAPLCCVPLSMQTDEASNRKKHIVNIIDSYCCGANTTKSFSPHYMCIACVYGWWRFFFFFFFLF